MNRDTPSWQPIGALPMIASFIDGMVSDTTAQWETLQPARAKPHVLDSALVERIERAYSEQLDTSALFLEQLSRWRQGPLSAEQSNEVTRLEGQVAILRANLTNILDLAAEVKDHTIDKILEKDDLALGLDVLLGKHRL
ncbi:MAG: hypothetical protein WBM97_12845 [Sedimenticolaceae bacterium]|jgi:hypothetical protein